MSTILEELKYTESHEWVRDEGSGLITVGITDHAQASLGDLVFIEVPEIESSVGPGEACCVVESVKAASDVYCPVAGEISEVNGLLADEPELVNTDPYEDGWLFRVQCENIADLGSLLDAEGYTRFLANEDD